MLRPWGVSVFHIRRCNMKTEERQRVVITTALLCFAALSAQSGFAAVVTFGPLFEGNAYRPLAATEPVHIRISACEGRRNYTLGTCSRPVRFLAGQHDDLHSHQRRSRAAFAHDDRFGVVGRSGNCSDY